MHCRIIIILFLSSCYFHSSTNELDKYESDTQRSVRRTIATKNYFSPSFAILASSANSFNRSNSPDLRQSSENSESSFSSKFQGVSNSRTFPFPSTRILSMSMIVRSRLYAERVSEEGGGGG